MADASEPQSSTDDIFWMRRALELASRGQGRVEPNPMVGCVVVRDGIELGHGWHERFGGPHAEVHALLGLSKEQIRHADVFVTLEPCSHYGKTPPCLDLLLQRKPRRVVIAMLDPFPQVSGRGVSGLVAAGIEVEVGLLESEAQQLNAPYLKRLQAGLPWVIAKWAMTLDGALATASGDSKWITGATARASAHRLRSRMDAIVVGSETVLMDDPLLTARLPEPSDVPRRCTRVVVDRRFRLPLESQLVKTAEAWPLCVATMQTSIDAAASKADALRRAGAEIVVLPEDGKTPPLEWLLKCLCQRGATNLLVEGGGKLLGAFFDGGWVDQVECYIAPRILGSSQAIRPIAGRDPLWMHQTKYLERIAFQQEGEDFHLSGLVRKTDATLPVGTIDQR